MIIIDEHGFIFGGFFTGDWQVGNSFYGTGESYLFTIKEEKDQIEHYLWTRKNNYFQYANYSGIAIGSSDGDEYGLFLNDKLDEGYSTPCETFGNT